MDVVNLSEYIIVPSLLALVVTHSYFFGAKVPKGSWFAWLQSVGMKG